MKVSTLIERLGELDPDLWVVLASDAEGNSLSFLDNDGFGVFSASEAADLEIDYLQADQIMEPCLVLYPV